MEAPTVTKHPAKFSPAVLLQIVEFLRQIDGRPLYVLDPFAGIGGVHLLGGKDDRTLGIELEKEWADQHQFTICGDARQLIEICESENFPTNCIVTSPCYGNRMADHHDAKDSSKRMTYKHQLGRDLTEGSAAVMQWGEEYRDFHKLIWRRCTDLVVGRHPAHFILNCKDHVRGGEVQDVSLWHIETLESLGWELLDVEIVDTPGMGFGANRSLRAPEYVAMLRLQ